MKVRSSLSDNRGFVGASIETRLPQSSRLNTLGHERNNIYTAEIQRTGDLDREKRKRKSKQTFKHLLHNAKKEDKETVRTVKYRRRARGRKEESLWRKKRKKRSVNVEMKPW